MKKILIYLTIFILLTGQAAADHRPDNPLDSFYSAKKVKWAVQIDGTYPELQSKPDQDSITLSRGYSTDHGTLSFDVSKPANIKAAYLYVFTKGYDCTCEEWLVEFNSNQITTPGHMHTDSIGPNPDGDGDGGMRETLRFDVTNYVVDGTNEVYFKGLNWEGKSASYTIDGVVLVTFYDDSVEHEYWLYEGVEYLERNLVTDPSSYAIDLAPGTYPDGANGTLYVLYHNGNEPDDFLYFNDNLLNDSDGAYLLGTENSNYLTMERYAVSDYLTGDDVINFTYGVNMNTPIFPSLFILDVDLSDSKAPVVTFTSPANNSVFPANTTVEVSLTVDDPDATVAMEIGGENVTPSNPSPGNWSYPWDLTGLWNSAQGFSHIHKITAYATDLSGNTGSASLSLNVTKPAPKVVVTNPMNGSILPKSGSITIETTVDDPNATVSIEIDGEKVADNASYTWDLSAESEGIHTISAIATDVYNQKGSDTITVNITAGEVPETSPPPTTIPPTTSPPTSPPPTSPPPTKPPETTPPVTEPPLPQVDLAINSLTLSTGSTTIEADKDITVYALASNAGEENLEATIALYSDSDLLESKTFGINGYDSRKVEFTIRGSELKEGIHTLKAKILVQGANVEERDPSNNERVIDIVVEEASDTFGLLKTILKWAAAAAILLVVARITINFITGGGEDYLR